MEVARFQTNEKDYNGEKHLLIFYSDLRLGSVKSHRQANQWKEYD
jgi:hypothetical protein